MLLPVSEDSFREGVSWSTYECFSPASKKSVSRTGRYKHLLPVMNPARGFPQIFSGTQSCQQFTKALRFSVHTRQTNKKYINLMYAYIWWGTVGVQKRKRMDGQGRGCIIKWCRVIKGQYCCLFLSSLQQSVCCWV